MKKATGPKPDVTLVSFMQWGGVGVGWGGVGVGGGGGCGGVGGGGGGGVTKMALKHGKNGIGT